LLPTTDEEAVAIARAQSGLVVSKVRRRADVRMYHTADGGEISCVNGVLELADGLFNAAYLSLFGGNEQDSGLQADDRAQWWGNFTETEPARRYRSETQYLLRALPAIPANMRRVEEAAGRDLGWFLDSGLATLVSPLATIPALNTIKLTLNIESEGNAFEFEFLQHWGAT
jgi:phage gp46-like protein